MELDSFQWHDDCRHFVGARPCKYWRPCEGCGHFEPVSKRILIVLLGLLGDMLIASPVPARLKRDDPSAHITWLVSKECAEVVAMNPYVDRVLTFSWEAATSLLSETFDIVLGYERNHAAASLVDRISAGHKAGLAYGGPHNTLYGIGEAAQYFFVMNTWNDFRVNTNIKTWTALYLEVAGYAYEEQPYILDVKLDDAAYVADRLAGSTRSRVCLNIGASLPTKRWPNDSWFALGMQLLREGYDVLVTGGPMEFADCRNIESRLAQEYPKRVWNFPMSIGQFCAIPRFCSVVVTGDSFGFHVALAHQCPCVLLLGPSSGSEVVPSRANVFIIRSQLPCSPCAHQVVCGGAGGCMQVILVDEVAANVRNAISSKDWGKAK